MKNITILSVLMLLTASTSYAQSTFIYAAGTYNFALGQESSDNSMFGGDEWDQMEYEDGLGFRAGAAYLMDNDIIFFGGVLGNSKFRLGQFNVYENNFFVAGSAGLLSNEWYGSMGSGIQLDLGLNFRSFENKTEYEFKNNASVYLAILGEYNYWIDESFTFFVDFGFAFYFNDLIMPNYEYEGDLFEKELFSYNFTYMASAGIKYTLGGY